MSEEKTNLSKTKYPKDISNIRFGKLVAIKFFEKVRKKQTVTFWLFKCDCGNEKIINKRNVIRGASASCGCDRYNHQFKKPYGEAMLTVIMCAYKNSARKRKLDFQLSIKDIKILTKGNCYFCNSVPKTIAKRKKANGEYIYNGIDRLDNKKGYIISNCVSCCEDCNRAKLEMTVDEFKCWIQNVYKFFIEGKT